MGLGVRGFVLGVDVTLGVGLTVRATRVEGFPRQKHVEARRVRALGGYVLRAGFRKIVFRCFSLVLLLNIGVSTASVSGCALEDSILRIPFRRVPKIKITATA